MLKGFFNCHKSRPIIRKSRLKRKIPRRTEYAKTVKRIAVGLNTLKAMKQFGMAVKAALSKTPRFTCGL